MASPANSPISRGNSITPPASNSNCVSPPSSLHAKPSPARLATTRKSGRETGHDERLLLGADLPRRPPCAGDGWRGGGRRVLGQQAAEAAAAVAAVRDGRAAPGLRVRRHGHRVARLPPTCARRRRLFDDDLRGRGGGAAGVVVADDGVRGCASFSRPSGAGPRAAGPEAQGPPRGGDGRRRVRGQPPGGPAACARRQRDRGGQPLHGAQGERAAPRRQPELRDDPARRGGADPAGGGPDLPPGVPGVARALQAQPREDHQDQRGGHAQHAGARQARRRQVPAHQHQRGLRRPAAAPAGRDLLGERQPNRCSELLRRGQADGGDAHHGLPPRRQPRGEDCSDLQHLRTPHVHRRRPSRQQLRRAGTEEGAADGVRRRQADAELPVRLRFGGGPDEADGGRPRGALQPGQPRRVHDAGAGQGGAGHHRPQRAHRVPAKHRRRPAQAQAGHQPRQGAAGVGAQGLAPERPAAHGAGLPQPHLRRPQGRQRRGQLMIVGDHISAAACAHYRIVFFRRCTYRDGSELN